MRMRRFASIRFAFGGNVTLSTSTHRHYDESVHRIKQLTRGNNTIGFSDILSRIRNSTTTGSAVRVVYRGPFMSEDRCFDLSTPARYVLFIADRSCRKIGVRPLNCTISCYYVQAVRPESRYKRQFGSNSLLFTAFKTVYSSTLA